MTYKFNIAGYGSPEIEMRGPRFLSGKYNLYHDGKLLDKTGPSAKRKLIEMPEGNSFYIILYPYLNLPPYFPPKVVINGETILNPETPRYYEYLSCFMQFAMIMAISISVTNITSKFHFLGVVLISTPATVTFVLFALLLDYHYAKMRDNFGNVKRIGFSFVNLVLIFVFTMGIRAAIKMLFK